MRRRDFVVSAAAAASLTGCGVLTSKHTLRYRLTLEVMASGVERRASTVLQSTWVDTLGLGQKSRWPGETLGDAITVMRDGASALIGMLGFVPGYEGGFTLPYDWLDFLLSRTERDLPDDQRFEAVRGLKGSHPLPSFQWPLMAYIADVGNLASARLISKETPDDRFSIQECSFAVTTDPISRGIENTLPCLRQVETYHNNPVVPVRNIPPYQLFRMKNFSASGDGI